MQGNISGEYLPSTLDVEVGRVAPTRITKQRALHVNLRDENGNTVGSSSSPTYIDKAQYKTEFEDAGSGTLYLGNAVPGTLTSAASWRIKKIVDAGTSIEITFADGNSNFDNIWDDRASLSYS